MKRWSRREAVMRTELLLASSPHSGSLPKLELVKDPAEHKQTFPLLENLIAQSGLRVHYLLVIAACAVCALAFTALSSKIFSAPFPLLFLALGAYLPISFLRGRIDERAQAFILDYPSVLLATASSIKAGMMPYAALERATQLLEEGNLVRKEVTLLLERLRSGSNKEKIVRSFAKDIALPELELFRNAFLLVLENGGRFAPTLERLANVSKDRAVLIGSARVSTSSMRMTANVLLAITPLLMLMLSAQIPNFWDKLFADSLTNTIASTGAMVIILNYALLRRMSAFQP